jgi:protein-S-isoprenylcysteine O-methyltransferase Ste14
MIAWINFAVLLLASILFLLFYVRSASPTAQEMVIGPRAYKLCFYNRSAAAVFEFLITANIVLYRFFPLPTPLPENFPWPWWVSAVIAAAIGIPAGVLMFIGIRDAGEETMRPKKEHAMYGGIYAKIRHPQAVGEYFLLPAIGILLHSPFLTLFSLFYLPIFLVLCYVEETDLMLRFGDSYAEYCRRTGAFWPKRRKDNARED